MCSRAFIVASKRCLCMIISIYESASHDKKPWPKSISYISFALSERNRGSIMEWSITFLKMPSSPTSEYGRSPFITIFILLFFWDFLLFFSWIFLLGLLLFFTIISSKEKSSVVYQKYLCELLAYSSRRDCTVKVSSEMRASRFILVNLRSCP